MVTSEGEGMTDRRIFWYPYKNTATASYLFSNLTDSFGDGIKY
jgi:hypothetical protein